MKTSKVILLALITVCLSTVCFAQSAATGDLHVIVKDAKASLVTNATVTVRDAENGFERSTAVNNDGQYNILALPPRIYTVTVEAAGFAKASVKNVRITVGQLAELPVELAVAGAQETVSVSAEAELIETERTSSTNTIEQRRIENLPINGRNYINFALTDSRLARDDAPSIGAAPTSGLNMSGQRGRANLVNVDGADSVDNSTNGIRSTISQEGVQEFQIQTNGYAAEYGRASGGVVNIVTKGGTNDLHGSIYGYLRNRSFQAVNPFSTVKDPAYTRVQPGITLGGPIKKGKTFFFFSYEGTWRQETGFSSIGADNFGLQPFDATRIFNPLAPAGTFTIQATPDQVNFLTPFATAGIAPLPVQFYTFVVGASSGIALDGSQPQTFALLPFAPPGSGLQQFPTSCNFGTPAVICGGLPASFVNLKSLQGNFPVSEHTDLYSLRIDHNFTANNRLSLRGAASPSDLTGIQVQAQGPQNFGQNAFSRTSTQNYHDWSITGQDQWILGGNKINELRFQYARRGLLYSFSRGEGGGNVAVNIPGFAFFGREPFSFVNRTEQRYQFTDNFSLTKGTHSFKFGADVNYLPLTADFTVNFGGIYNFAAQSIAAGTPALNPVQAYGAGIPSNFIQGVGGPHDSFSNKTLGVFAQDSWRIKTNLTLNYGVRYDVEFTPTFNATNSAANFGQQFLGITQGIPRDTNNFAPRIGIAWDPWKTGKGVFRASYGIFYDHPLLALAFDSDVADGSQAPQFVLFGGSPCTGIGTPNPLNLNAA
ncbi:MAG TPA: TonB-dependent receptor, partial [Terriglobales bacterium]|nr:TonB-dependent receptor [Terriglobales bacterium]